MQELVENKWFFWIVTGVIAAMWAAELAAAGLSAQEIAAKLEEERERVNRLISELPINYTLRDEFLRVTTAQNTKLDKITDMIADIGADIAGIKGREKGE